MTRLFSSTEAPQARRGAWFSLGCRRSVTALQSSCERSQSALQLLDSSFGGRPVFRSGTRSARAQRSGVEGPSTPGLTALRSGGPESKFRSNVRTSSGARSIGACPHSPIWPAESPCARSSPRVASRRDRWPLSARAPAALRPASGRAQAPLVDRILADEQPTKRAGGCSAYRVEDVRSPAAAVGRSPLPRLAVGRPGRRARGSKWLPPKSTGDAPTPSLL
jgi:hypothetical protein